MKGRGNEGRGNEGRGSEGTRDEKNKKYSSFVFSSFVFRPSSSVFRPSSFVKKDNQLQSHNLDFATIHEEKIADCKGLTHFCKESLFYNPNPNGR